MTPKRSTSAVRKWCRALGAPRWNEGDLRLKVANGKRNERAIQAMHAKARDPARRAKIAASKLGKPRPPEVIEALIEDSETRIICAYIESIADGRRLQLAARRCIEIADFNTVE